MGRRRRNHQRDALSIPNGDPPRDPVADLIKLPQQPIFSPLVRFKPSIDVEDHRRWTPDDWRPPRLRSSRVAQVHLPQARGRPTSTVGRPFSDVQALYFRAPQNVNECVRRSTRKEVLFALKRTGKGSKAPRRRRGRFSNVRC